ncbi:RHS repeat-associated core domain-containing protein [Pleionea sediminis]|uniref:RHS repeat-associated core domain-containing protein n=1 Tax=Pleionea sediminis TaxID=2569479 RepID=UPI001185A533|nr:RHS repeat-associated core domain-containing protein [Pleionea sediminis]
MQNLSLRVVLFFFLSIVSFATQAFLVPTKPIVIPKPPAPSSLTFSDHKDKDGNYTISWSSADYGNFELEERNVSSGSSYVQIYRGLNKSFSVSGKAPGTYDYRVRVCGLGGCSTYRNSDYFIEVQGALLPPTVSLSTSKSTNGNYSVSWNAISGASQYQLQERVNSGSWSTVQTSSSRSKSLSGKTNGTYSYRARACRSLSPADCSSFSSVKSVIVSRPVSEAGSTTGFDSKSSSTTLSNQPLTNTAPTESDNVGALKGGASAQGGAATYSIPIDLPPGRNGLQPSVSLDYSSKSGARDAGLGWSLSAWASIERCQQTYVQDGKRLGIQYASNDKLCLGGERLVVVNGMSYGAAGAEYRTEKESFSLIRQIGSGGSRYFIETMANGSTRTFGKSNNSKIYKGNSKPLGWALETHQDLASNRVDYRYTANLSNGEFYLKHIYYTGFNSSLGNRRVTINWETDAETVQGYFAGSLFSRTQRVASIETYIGNELAQQYNLTYTTAATSGASLLKSVEVCATNNRDETCLEPTTFDWYSEDTAIAELDVSLDKNTAGGIAMKKIIGWNKPVYMDVNSDGSDDRIRYETSYQSRVYIDWSNDGVTEELQYSLKTSSSDNNKKILGLANINGNGVPTFLVLDTDPDRENNEGRRVDVLQLANFNRANNSIDVSSTPVEVLWGARILHTDVNADGLDDLLVPIGVRYRTNAPDEFRIGIFMNQGGSFISTPSKTFYFEQALWSQGSFQAEDFNGDGYAELAFYRWSTSSITQLFQFSSDYSNLQSVNIPLSCNKWTSALLDINGDGLKDYICNRQLYWNTGKLGSLFVSSGLSLTSSQFPYLASTKHEVPPHQKVADLNLNGKDELYVVSSRTPVYTYTSGAIDPCDTGSIPSPLCGISIEDNLHVYTWNRIRYDASQNALVVENSGIRSSRLLTFEDYDLDGNLDIYEYQEPYDDDMWPVSGQLTVHQRQVPNGFEKLYKATNAFGSVAQFDYAKLSDPGMYIVTEEPQYPEPLVRNSSVVVKAFHQDSGTGAMNTTEYQYQNGRQNYLGRGYLGFETIITKAPYLNTKVITDFEQSFPLTGKVKSVRTYQYYTGQLLSSKDIEYGWFGPSLPLANESITSRRAGNGFIDNSTYSVFAKRELNRSFSLAQWGQEINRTELLVNPSDFDTYGNLTKQVSKVDNGFSEVQKTITSTFEPDVDAWWLNKLTSTVTTSKTLSNNLSDYDASLDSTKTVSMFIDEYRELFRSPSKVRTVSGEGKTVTTDTTYTTYGQTKTVTTTAGGQSRTKTIDYTSDAYFAESTENDYFTESTSVIDAYLGKPTVTTDVNGNQVKQFYDAFGRVKRIESAGTPHQYIRYYWCDGCDVSNSNIVYKVVKTSAGSPTVTEYRDAMNRVIVSSTENFDGSLIYSSVEYDAQGRKRFESIASDNAFETRGVHYESFDVKGRLTHKIIDQPYNRTFDVKYQYGSGDRFTTRINVNDGDRVVFRTHAGNGQLIKTEDAEEGETFYVYDAAGNPIVLKDANGALITAKYNSLGQKLWTNDPNMGLKTFNYTGFGEVYSETDANDQTLRYTYDKLGRKTHVYVNDVLDSQFEFDTAVASNGKVCQGLLESESVKRSGENFSKTYGYDARCRVVTTDTTIDGTNYRVTQHYDANYGRLKGMKYPNGLTVEYNYNERGYLETTKNPVSGYEYSQLLEMDSSGNWIAANIANGHAGIDRTFFAENGQMASTTLVRGSIDSQQVTYEYDRYSNLTAMEMTNPYLSMSDVSREIYTFDDLDRIKSSTLFINGVQNTPVTYDYDASGNLKRKSDFSANSTSAYTYNGVNVERSNSNNWAGPNAVRSIKLSNGTTRQYRYDKAGNLETDGLRTITYNAFNKPTQIQTFNGRINPKLDAQNTGNNNSQFFYDAGQMRYKQVANKNGEIVTTIYVGKLYEKITTRSGSTTKVQHKTYLGDTAVLTEEVTSSGTSNKIGFFHRDRLGSMIAVVNNSGRVVEGHSFDVFGRPRTASLQSQLQQTLNSSYTTRGYTDHEHLNGSQLIHMNGRVYDYNTGRFLNVDPFIQSPDNSQSLNPYSYIMNNPLAGTDPSGYLTVCQTFIVCSQEQWNDENYNKPLSIPLGGNGNDSNSKSPNGKNESNRKKETAKDSKDDDEDETSAGSLDLSTLGGGVVLTSRVLPLLGETGAVVAEGGVVGIAIGGIYISLKPLTDAWVEVSGGRILGGGLVPPIGDIGVSTPMSQPPEDPEEDIFNFRNSNDKKTANPLNSKQKAKLRAQARNLWEKNTGSKASSHGLQIHHRVPLQWSHKFPKAHPNRLANLVGVNQRSHSQITNAWRTWEKGLNGKSPTRVQIIKQAVEIDKKYGSTFKYMK